MSGLGSEEVCASEQAEILLRVKHLSGEKDSSNDVYNANQSAIMNFGIHQDPVATSLQSLAIDQKKSLNKERLRPTNPPPGFCSDLPFNPVQLVSNAQNSHKSIFPALHSGFLPSTAQSSSLSLKGLAGASEISSTTPQTSGLSLSSLATSHLAATGSQSFLSSSQTQQNSGLSLSSLPTSQISLPAKSGSLTSSPQPSGLSLSSLATSHLATTGPQISLSGSLTAPSDTKPSLSNLASTHLESSRSQGPAFTIPTIFGAKEDGCDSASVSSSSAQQEINLMSALKLNNDQEMEEKEAEDRTCTADSDTLHINILVQQNSFDSIKSILRKRTKTPFSFTLTRKWQRKKPKPSLKIQSLPDHEIEIFKFDSPSPDDIVVFAQKKSRAFNR